MKKMQHEKILIATVLYGKRAQEQCTIVHKWITGCALVDRYTLLRGEGSAPNFSIKSMENTLTDEQIETNTRKLNK